MVINSLEYRRAKARAEELHQVLLNLDNAAEILYTNIKYDDIFRLISKLEDVRLKYYMEYEANTNVLELKGTSDVKRN